MRFLAGYRNERRRGIQRSISETIITKIIKLIIKILKLYKIEIIYNFVYAVTDFLIIFIFCSVIIITIIILCKYYKKKTFLCRSNCEIYTRPVVLFTEVGERPSRWISRRIVRGVSTIIDVSSADGIRIS